MFWPQASRYLAIAWVVGALLAASATGFAGALPSKDSDAPLVQAQPLTDSTKSGNLSSNETHEEGIGDDPTAATHQLEPGANASNTGNTTPPQDLPTHEPDDEGFRKGHLADENLVTGTPDLNLTLAHSGTPDAGNLPNEAPPSNQTSAAEEKPDPGVETVMSVTRWVKPPDPLHNPLPGSPLTPQFLPDPGQDSMPKVLDKLNPSVPPVATLREPDERWLWGRSGSDPGAEGDRPNDPSSSPSSSSLDIFDSAALFPSGESPNPVEHPNQDADRLHHQDPDEKNPAPTGDLGPRKSIMENPGDTKQFIATLPVVVGIAAALTVLAWRLEWLLKTLQLLLFRLFTRIHEDDVLKNNKRRKIFSIIQQNPGIHYREISDMFNLPYNTVSYHVEVLRRHKKVLGFREGKTVHLYEADLASTPDGLKRLRTLPNPVDQKIRGFLEQSPGATQAEIAVALGIHHVRVFRRVNVLLKRGLCMVKGNDTGLSRYYVIPEGPEQDSREAPGSNTDYCDAS